MAHNLGDPCVGGGRRDKEDQVKPGGLAERAALGRFFGRQIGDDQPVGAGGGGFGDEARQAVAQKWVEVAHQHQRRAQPAPAQLADRRQAIGQTHAIGQRLLGGTLDRRAVGEWVREWHAQFEQIGAGSLKRGRQLQRRVALGEADHQIWHQGGAASGLELGERFGDTAHICSKCTLHIVNWKTLRQFTICNLQSTGRP